MGGAVSSGRNNDDLIDNLLEADYIKTALIERVFRAVDRGEYFLPDSRVDAYKDLAWKSGNLHISAPCIYSEVMEGLELEPGLSFLNLGSGTGYLSTMVGLILGSRGINHGVELHKDVIEYAFRKLEDFKKFSGAVDEFDFCEPKFVQGNCFFVLVCWACASENENGLYDRIYCGAACPEEYLQFLKLCLKLNGILVVPVNEQLYQIKRLSKTFWQTNTLLPVSFASLIAEPKGFQGEAKPIEVVPLSLQAHCRVVIRNILRKNIEKEHPPVKSTSKVPKKKRALKRLVVPLFNDDSSDDERHVVGLGGEQNRDAGRAMFRQERDEERLFGLFWNGIPHRRGTGSSRDRPSSHRKNKETRKSLENIMEVATSNQNVEEETVNAQDNSAHSSSDLQEEPTSHRVQAVIEHHEHNEDMEAYIRRLKVAVGECIEKMVPEADEEQSENGQRTSGADNCENEDKIEALEDNHECTLDSAESKPSTSSGAEVSKRGKVDSGIGDEIIEAHVSSDEADNVELDAISSCDEDGVAEKRHKGDSSISETENEEEPKESANEMRMYRSPCTQYMREKIQELPLPLILKRYLNFYRDLSVKNDE